MSTPVSQVVFFDAIYPPLQSIGVGISPYTLAYTCEGKTEAIDACVVSDCTNQVELHKGDLFVSVNGEPLLNLSTGVHYDTVIAKLGRLTNQQRTIRFLRCSTDCHDASVNAAIVVICPEEAALLFDPTHRDVYPEYEEVDFPSSTAAPPLAVPPLTSGSGPATNSLIAPTLQSHPYYSSTNLEDEVRREMHRLAEELRQAEEEDNRQIELEVQRQLVELAQMSAAYGPTALVGMETTPASASAAAGAALSAAAYSLKLQEE